MQKEHSTKKMKETDGKQRFKHKTQVYSSVTKLLFIEYRTKHLRSAQQLYSIA